jgi:hypothetical protein
MGRFAALACVFTGVALAGAGAQAPADPAGPKYLFVDGNATRARLTRAVNFEKVRERLVDAGVSGYGLQFVAGLKESINLLLCLDGGGPRHYRLIETSREGPFLDKVNEAAADGYRVVPGGIKVFEGANRQVAWLAVMVAQPDAARVRYSVVKGTPDGQQTLAGASASGRRLAAVVGRQGMVAANTLLFFEEGDGGAAAPAETGARDYRIIATARTSTLQKELAEAAAAGFHVVGSGFGYMTFVMARGPGSTPEPAEYRVIAMIRVATAARELEEAGNEGYQIAAMSENGPEVVFVLHRQAGVPDPKASYQLVRLQEATASAVLTAAEAGNYRIAGLLNDFVLLERH